MNKQRPILFLRVHLFVSRLAWPQWSRKNHNNLGSDRSVLSEWWKRHHCWLQCHSWCFHSTFASYTLLFPFSHLFKPFSFSFSFSFSFLPCLFPSLNQQKHIFEKLGYCPQNDSLFRGLTVAEHLNLYAKLKGVVNPSQRADAFVEMMGLQNNKNRLANKLSGGNKRKLCLSIAFVGNPDVVILDEPSSGWEIFTPTTNKKKRKKRNKETNSPTRKLRNKEKKRRW